MGKAWPGPVASVPGQAGWPKHDKWHPPLSVLAVRAEPKSQVLKLGLQRTEETLEMRWQHQNRPQICKELF